MAAARANLLPSPPALVRHVRLPPTGATVAVRAAHVDWLRAGGICLVVYGHSQGVPAPLYHFIYSFHMPLFFFLSGLTLKPEKLDGDFRSYALSVCRSLIPPYLFFAVLGYAAWLLVGRHYSSHTSGTTPLLRPLGAIAYGSGTRDDLLQPMVLWFFPCLLTAQLFFWGVARQSRSLGLVVIAILAGLGVLARHLVLPWEIESALLALPFLWLGHEAGRCESSRARPRLFSPALLVLSAFAAFLLSRENVSVDLRKSEIGQPLLFFAAAALMIHALYGLARMLPAAAWIERVSRHTIVIFPLHPHAFWGFAAFYALVPGQPALRQNPWIAPVASLAVVALLTLAARPLQGLIGILRDRCFPRQPVRRSRPAA